MKLLPIIFLLLTLPASAEIYKSVDADGNVIYTDAPDSSAEEFVPPSMNAIPMPRLEHDEVDEPEAEPTMSYQLFTITSPSDDAVLRDNTGTVLVNMTLTPALQEGHSISIIMDEHVIVRRTNQLSVSIPDIHRGSHSVYAIIQNAAGKRIKRSNVVTFHVKRHSALLNKQTPTGPRDALGRTIQPGPQDPQFRAGPAGNG